MVFGYHVTMGMYGFWLPNDPRGSWSDFVRSLELLRRGNATKTSERRSVARAPHDRRARVEAKKALRHQPVKLDGVQARAIGRGFGTYAESSGLSVFACAILPDHVHLVIGRHRLPIEQVVNMLKGAATRRLVAEGFHPMSAHPTAAGKPPKVFARGHWRVFLNDSNDIRRAIAYVRRNPPKEGKPVQNWSFVVPFDP